MTRNNWSWKLNLQLLSTLYSLTLIRIYGLWPYTIDRQTKIFKTSWFLMLQPILTGIIFIVAFVVVFPMILPSMTRRWNSDAANILMTIFGTINFVSLVTTYVSVYSQTEMIKSIIARSQKIMLKSHRLLTDHQIRTASANLLYLFKSFVLLVCFTTLTCYKLRIATQSMSVLALPFIAIPIMIELAIPNLFFGTILFATIYFERINAKIMEIVRSANQLSLQEHKNFGRMFRYCKLSDLLDELAVLHVELTQLTQDICKVCNFDMTRYIMWLTLNAIVQKFFAFMCISVVLKGLITFPTKLVIVLILNITFIWIELFMFARLCLNVTHEVVFIILTSLYPNI